MSKPKNSQGKRSTKASTGAKASRSGAAMKDLAPTGRAQSSAKGGKRTVVKDANDKYA